MGKYKKRLRKLRINLSVSNTILDENLDISDAKEFSTKKLHKTKYLKLKVPTMSQSNLSSLRMLSGPVFTENEREHCPKKRNVVLFEVDKKDALELNGRPHEHVSDIEFYKRSTETIMNNRECISAIRKKKNSYRDQMLIEKSVGMYDADQVTQSIETVNCHFCNDILDEKDGEERRC